MTSEINIHHCRRGVLCVKISRCVKYFAKYSRGKTTARIKTYAHAFACVCVCVCVRGARVPYAPEPDMYVRCWLNVTVVMEEISRDTSHQYERERDEYEWNGFPVWLSPNQFYICIRICRTRGVSNKGSLIFSSFSVALHGTHLPLAMFRSVEAHIDMARKKKRTPSNRFSIAGVGPLVSATYSFKYVTINYVSVRARVRHGNARLFPAHYRMRAGTWNTFKCVISVWNFIKIPSRLRPIFAKFRYLWHLI